jgi:tropomyosin, fungi type
MPSSSSALLFVFSLNCPSFLYHHHGHSLVSFAFKMAGALANFHQKMNSLRIEADENASKAEELKAKVKALEQENLQKEQEITSLTHRNQLLEGEVEKLETGIKEAKSLAGESAQHGQQNEALTRKLQLLEEEAESADKTLRETNEK